MLSGGWASRRGSAPEAEGLGLGWVSLWRLRPSGLGILHLSSEDKNFTVSVEPHLQTSCIVFDGHCVSLRQQNSCCILREDRKLTGFLHFLSSAGAIPSPESSVTARKAPWTWRLLTSPCCPLKFHFTVGAAPPSACQALLPLLDLCTCGSWHLAWPPAGPSHLQDLPHSHLQDPPTPAGGP